jgi:hypothetical protein
VLCRFSAFALDSEMLLFALEKQPIEQQQDHGTDDRHDPARWLSGLVPAEGLAEVTGNERASDAEQNRDDKTTGIFPGINSLAIAPTTRPTRIVERIAIVNRVVSD